MARDERLESAEGRRARLAERDRYVRESDARRLAVEAEQQRAHEEARALEAQAAAIREKIGAAERQQAEEREQRRKDWAALTIASFDHEFREAKAALDGARRDFAEGVIEPGQAVPLYLELVKAGARFTAVQERHRRALAASGAKQDRNADYEYRGASFRLRNPHIQGFTEEAEQAIAAQAGRIRAEAEAAIDAEQAAAVAGV